MKYAYATNIYINQKTEMKRKKTHNLCQVSIFQDYQLKKKAFNNVVKKLYMR
ncbi:hypothetical protein pb186bvf_017024 [Paramecium bursaria]